MSGSPKAASRHRSGAATPKKGNRSVASHHSNNNNNSSSKSPHAGGAAAGSAKEVALSHVPVHSLSHLQDLLRPLAGPRIAAVARALNMDGEAAAATAATAAGTGGGGSSLRSASAAASGVDSGSAPATPLPPPVSNDDHTTAIAPTVNPHQHQQQHGAGGKASHASAATSSVGVSTTAATAAEGAAVQATVPSLGLLLASATQLGGLLAQWRSYTAMARRDAAAASAAAGGGGGGRPPQAPSPTAGSHSAKATQGESKVAAPPPSAERVLELLQVVLWYALATTEGARLAAGGRSHGTSGRATPALPGTAAAMAAAAAAGGGAGQYTSDGGAASLSLSSAARGRGGRGGSVGRAGSVARSGSVTSSGVSADPVGATDWLGSRMAAPSTATTAGGGASSTAAAAVVMSDDQLAEHLFRPAVDAVVLLQDRASVSLLLPHSSGGEAEADTAATSPSGHHGKKQKKGGPAAAATAEGGDATAAASAGADEMNLGVELQAVALWTLAALLVRFADSPFNASVFLPVLFPQVDVRGAKGASARHPILQPLLRGDAAHESAAQSPHGKRNKSTSDGGAAAVGVSLRCGAATALTALLHKLQPTLLYAEEPHPNRQAFISLATQCGTMLLSLHESLCWALSDANGSTAASAAAAPLLSTYASVVGVTPYNRCPRSRAAVLQTLHLPVIRTYLANDACAEYVPTTVLVANVFKNESMRGAAAQLLATTASDTTTITTAAAATTAASAAPVVDQAGAGATTPKAEKAGKKSASASGDSFLSALLSHADTRLEVWRCMVPLSRLYPRMVHSEFYALMAASVRVVAALTAWEAAEEAAETAALEATAPAAAEGEGGEEEGGDDDGACTPRGQHLPAASSAAVSLTTSPKRSPQPDGAGHHDPHNPRSPSASAKKSAAKASGRSRARPGPAAPPEAFAECLRTWLHFMGYVWKAFDDNACDPALSAEGQQDRATLTQKQRIHMDLLRPAMRLRRCGEEVRTMTLRCIAQIGDDYLGTLSEPALGQELVQYVQVCIADPQPRVRGEALTTLGVWLWQYPSMDAFACVAIDNAVHSIMVDPNPLVRTKAAFALSNVTSRLPDQTCPTVRDSPEYMATLCATAMHAAVIDTESGVQGHGIRMMNHLLQVLSFDELISEVEEFEEGVAEGFLRVLLECLRAATRNNNNNNNNSSIHSMQQSYANSSMTGGGGWYAAPREAKHRWNAACALGMGLAREEVFEAEPKYAVEAVEALCTAVVRDHIFKVRTQAAGALGRVPGDCLGGAFSTEDLTPRVVRSLCEALESATATENFRQYKEQGTLHGALRAALGVMITTAKPSIELDKVFANYQKLLQKEQLL